MHSDLCKVDVPSLGKANYFMTILDDHSRYCFLYFLKNKSDVYECFKKFEEYVQTQTGHKIKRFRTDNGREYINHRVEELLANHGIHVETTVPPNAESNGRAERLNRTLLDKARCMLQEAKLPSKFWAEAISCAAYLSNRSPNSALHGKIPYQLWTGKALNLSHLRVFGCKVLAHVPRVQRSKMAPTSKPCVMLGYATNQVGYRLWSLALNKVIVIRDAVFFENIYPFNEDHDTVYLPSIQSPNQIETEAKDIVEDQNEQIIDKDHPLIDIPEEPADLNINEQDIENLDNNSDMDIDDSVPVPARIIPTQRLSRPLKRLARKGLKRPVSETTASSRPKRKITVPKHIGVYQVNYSNFLSTESNRIDPISYKAALASPEREQWIKAMQKEMASIKANKTWKLCTRPPGVNVVGRKWVYKTKTQQGIEEYKARLVAQGYSQIKGQDYNETFAPVIRLSTIRLLIAMAAVKNWEIFHYDVNSAFLQGKLDEVIYLAQPRGFVLPGQEHLVCKLLKAIYGLKQGGKCWNRRLHRYLISIFFIQSDKDQCMYFLIVESSFIIITVFVDDLLFFSNNIELVNLIKSKLFSTFSMKDLGPVKKCFGFNVVRDRSKRTITLDQEENAKSVLHNINMDEDHH